MKKRTLLNRCTALSLALSLLLSLAACGNQARATTMHLKHTEGTVAVSDDAGADVPLLEDLGLYSGYGVDTRPASFAWINLDDVKLTKMDEESEIAIKKEDKLLEIEVKSGSLFFNVTQPLEEDETMNIRTSTMLVGIRGTCGWVEVPDPNHMNVYLLEGKVECTAGETVTVMAGEVGRMDGTAGTVTVEPFGQDAIPAFVQGELDGVSLDGIPETVEPEPEPEPEPSQEPDPTADALAQYRVIVGQADTYDYGSVDAPTGAYRYALVRMQAGYDVPALLLEQDTSFGISNVLVFQYEPDSGQVFQAGGTMMEGVAGGGGYRGSLFAAGDGNGILSTEFSSGNGMGSTSRVTLSGSTLQTVTLWEGNVYEDTDPTSEDPGTVEIGWHDIADLGGLDGWTPPVPVQPSTVEPEPAETALPTDGDRIVFRGTLGAYSYSEVLDLQGQADPNPGSDMGETYYLIVLDEPQTMAVTRGDGSGSREGEVHLIDVTYAEGIAQYAGQHLAFSIDPGRTYWPSDASLPLGEPRTDDVHILQ